ncbi:MAG: ParA family protein [Planctomycetota bacterium]|nr:MAG: ParA family protein [Planctomycetota bacterium]
MRTISVVNHKGGSGKTTTAVNLAAALALEGAQVLLIDCDPQASASAWLGVVDDDQGMLDCLLGKGKPQPLLRGTGVPRLHLLPGSSWLATFDRSAAAIKHPERLIAQRITRPLVAEGYDICIIDCPPAISSLSIGALVASDEVLIPVEAHVMAMAGVEKVMSSIATVSDRLNSALAIAGILVCRVDRRTTHCMEVEQALRERYPRHVLDTTIRENIRLAECPSFGKTIFEYDQRSPGAQDYVALAEEMRRSWKRRR